jgi:hypothetical protein
MALRTHNLPSGSLKMRLRWSLSGDVSRYRRDMRTPFLLPGHREKRLGRSRISDVSSIRMALGTHNLSSGRPKRRHCRSRWNDVSMCRKTMRTHFQHPGILKMRLGTSREVMFHVGEWPWELINLPSSRLKMENWWSRWCYVRRWLKAMQTHFLHPGHPKKRNGRSRPSVV